MTRKLDDDIDTSLLFQGGFLSGDIVSEYPAPQCVPPCQVENTRLKCCKILCNFPLDDSLANPVEVVLVSGEVIHNTVRQLWETVILNRVEHQNGLV